MPKTQPKSKVRIPSETPSAGLKPIPGPNAAGSTQDTLANQPLSAEAGKSRASSRSRPRTAKPRSRPTRPGRSTLIKRYEAAVRLLHRQQFERARAAFAKVISTDGQDKEICERALTHIRLCEQKIPRSHPAPKSAEELYNVAIILINNRRYRESMQYLKRALKRDPQCDYVIYALAVCNCRLGNTNRALKNLELAIDLKVENRFLAQRDSDFELLTRNSRFVSLVYPEEPTAATS